MEDKILNKIKGGLIVSCQALENEPLHSSYIMSKMAYAAYLGGAVGIRANSIADITEIKKVVDLPIIGIIKKIYNEDEVYITPTIKEVGELVSCGVDIIAMDCTFGKRPNNETLEDFIKKVKKRYPKQLLMADCSTYEEGMHAASLNIDLIGTTMSGYTEYTKGVSLPNISMMRALVKYCQKPVIAEGGIWNPDQLKEAMDAGVWSAVVGSAITRPMEITKRFVGAIK